jgi:alginate O-acetyltransferase complex protein AlgJ
MSQQPTQPLPGFAAPTHRLDRETAGAVVSPRVAKVMITIFLLMIAAPAVVQLEIDFSEQEPWPVLDLFKQRPTAKSLAAFSDNVARRSWLTHVVRAAGEGVGGPNFTTSDVTPGSDGFLFYKPEVEFVSGAGFLDPRFATAPSIVPAIVDFHRQLQKLGIHLILLPVPAKASIYPERIWPTYPLESGPALNPDWKRWLATLRASGVDVLDLTDEFWRNKPGDPPVFLRTDTHWSSRGMELAADKVVEKLKPLLGEFQPLHFETAPLDTPVYGDLARSANVWFNPAFPSGSQHLSVVRYNGQEVTTLPNSPVLLIGDSYSNNFKDRGGFAHQIMARLGAGVETRAGIGGVQVNERREELSDHPELLSGRKVVIWEFGARFLETQEVEAWEIYPIHPPTTEPTRAPAR